MIACFCLHFFSCISPQVCVYGVAAILWATAKFSLSPNQKLAMPRKLKRLLLEMAKRTPIERPTIVMAKKVLLSFECLLLCTPSFSLSSPTTSLVEQITQCFKKTQRVLRGLLEVFFSHSLPLVKFYFIFFA